MILTGIDCSEQYETMRRGEWPEPHPAIVAAKQAIETLLFEVPPCLGTHRSGRVQAGVEPQDFRFRNVPAPR